MGGGILARKRHWEPSGLNDTESTAAMEAGDQSVGIQGSDISGGEHKMLPTAYMVFLCLP